MVCPGLASAGTRNEVVRVSGLDNETIPRYEPASVYCHHFTVSAFLSGSLAVATSRTMEPGAEVRFSGPEIVTSGSWLAAANVGVTVHVSRAAKSRCASSNHRAVA